MAIEKAGQNVAPVSYLMTNEMMNKYLNHVANDNIRTPIYRIQLLNSLDETPIAELTDYTINTSGSLNVNLNEGTRRTISLSLANGINEFSEFLGNISIGTKFKLWLGYKIEEEEILFPQGVFILTDPLLQSENASRIATVNGNDKWSLLDGSVGGVLQTTFTLPMGNTLEEVFRKTLALDICLDLVPPNINIAIAGFKTTYDIVHQAGGSIADILLEVALNANAYVYYDVNGVLTVKPVEYDEVKPSIWRWDNGDINYLGGSKSYLINQVYNAVAIIADNLQNKDAPIVAYAFNNDIGDANSVVNLGWAKYYVPTDYLQGISTQKLATERANYELKKVASKQSNISMRSLALFHLTENEIVRISDDYLNASLERFLISGITFSIGTDCIMTVSLVKARGYL